MKKKAAFTIFSALFLSAAGAFYYGGAPEEADATEKVYIATENPQSIKEIERKELENKELAVSPTDNPTDKAEVEPEKQPPAANEQVIEDSRDTIKYGDSLYVNIMDEPKYQHMIKVAKKYGTQVYAVQNTDLFGFFKGKEMVIGKSTGVASASPQYVEMLKELYSGEGFLYEGVSENIDFVNKTGAKVTVEFARYEAYAISKKENGWIELSW
ncbi:TPA: hypothetical protein G9C53_005025 [Salmonella enterica subsp. enterica serovar Typhimurium var. 5-]|uniref:Uncharacterized protein n=1 Tax=Salmonella enterica subsp. enterica serovar Typhimurium var. 5- TaxID=1620419 RepID=A0A740QJ58_SALTM|nr:hypothetical protein [Salmonella enterica subsp. enterica serovar Typhimurium var. 5-]